MEIEVEIDMEAKSVRVVRPDEKTHFELKNFSAVILKIEAENGVPSLKS